MPAIDSKVAHVVDKAAGEAKGLEDEDALFDELEQESEKDASALRERRLQQLHQEVARAKLMREQGATGSYEEVKDEREILNITTQCKLSAVHFFRPDFNRCRILDGHLEVRPSTKSCIGRQHQLIFTRRSPRNTSIHASSRSMLTTVPS